MNELNKKKSKHGRSLKEIFFYRKSYIKFIPINFKSIKENISLSKCDVYIKSIGLKIISLEMYSIN